MLNIIYSAAIVTPVVFAITCFILLGGLTVYTILEGNKPLKVKKINRVYNKELNKYEDVLVDATVMEVSTEIEEKVEEEPTVISIPQETISQVQEPVIEVKSNESTDTTLVDEHINEPIIKTKEEGTLKITYHRSFMAKFIQSNDIIQEFYQDFKNYTLGYFNLKSRISFNYDSINFGGESLMKLSFRGKTLCVYYALAASEVPSHINTEINTTKRFEETPVFIRVKGPNKFMHALELVDILCGKFGIFYDEEREESYKLDYKSDKELLEENLIKEVKSKSNSVNQYIFASNSNHHKTTVNVDNITKTFERRIMKNTSNKAEAKVKNKKIDIKPIEQINTAIKTN